MWIHQMNFFIKTFLFSCLPVLIWYYTHTYPVFFFSLRCQALLHYKLLKMQLHEAEENHKIVTKFFAKVNYAYPYRKNSSYFEFCRLQIQHQYSRTKLTKLSADRVHLLRSRRLHRQPDLLGRSEVNRQDTAVANWLEEPI